MQQISAMNVSTSSQSNFLVNLRKKYFNHLIIGNLNINSLPNKFEDLKILVKGKVDIIVITESELDHTFPGSSFRISGYNERFRKDRNRNGGRILFLLGMIYREKNYRYFFFNEFEFLFIEINLSHSKWLFVACYHPPSQNDDLFFRKLSNQIDFYSKTYENMTKGLRKAIMRRSELETKYHKHRDIQSLRQYKKQKNFCYKLCKRKRKKYYSRLNIKDIIDSKKFWKTVQPLISDKCNVSNKINLVENDNIISDDYEIAEASKIFFENAVKNLNVLGDSDSLSPTFHLDNLVDIAVEKFKNHPSITLIKSNVNVSSNFFFTEVNFSDIFKEISSLNSKKQGTKDGIPAKCLKTACSESSSCLTKVWNEEMLTENSFPQNLKLADVVPVFKKCDPTCAKNYRPISVLPTVSKVFERLVHDQITRYMDAHLSNHLCGYRKGFNTQTALLSLIEKYKSILDKKASLGQY